MRAICYGFMVFVLVSAAALFFGHRFLLDAAGNYLVLNEPAVASDAIVAVSGEHSRRRVAMELFKDGLAPLLIFNVSDTTWFFGRGIDPVGSVLEAAGQAGIPADAILINGDVGSTWEDALAVRVNVDERGYGSLIIVSSPFNMRRVALTYRRVFRDTGVRLCFVSVPLEREKLALGDWWTRERELQLVVNEYLKIVLYRLKYLR